MVSCTKCGIEEPFPFVCSYCGKPFCGDHRLPESHDCEKLWMARPPSTAPPPSSRQASRNPFQPSGWLTGQPNKYWFSSTELKHLGLGALLVALVALNFTGFFTLTRVTILLALLFTASFLLHELAHKFVAQRAGLWSEFRITVFGALLTAVSIISPLKLIAPGAVMMSGQADTATVGKVTLAGPLTNIVLGFGFWISSFMIADPTNRFIFSWGAEVNAILAVFNMIPFGVLDGQKVMAWNFRMWAVGIGFAVVLLLLNRSL